MLIHDSTIFVSVVAYKDPCLQRTIQEALKNAANPKRIFFGVIEQEHIENRISPQRISPEGQIRYLGVEPIESRGVCWARALAMTLYIGEDWFFQIDSHTMFDRGWDSSLIAAAQDCALINPDFVISSYPSPFKIDGDKWVPQPFKSKVLVNLVKANEKFTDNLKLGFVAKPMDFEKTVQGFHVGAGCIFTSGRFVDTFPYDPQIYFSGEEQTISARLFTHGWDIFHIPKLPIYHLYETKGAPSRPKHWDKSENEGRTLNYTTLNKASNTRVDSLLSGDKDLGVFGLGRKRSVKQFAALFGVDYLQKTIEDKAYAGPLALLNPELEYSWNTSDKRLTSYPRLQQKLTEAITHSSKHAQHLDKVWLHREKIIVVDMKVGDHLVAFDITSMDLLRLEVEMFDRKNLLDIKKAFPQNPVTVNKRLEVIKIKIKTNKLEQQLVKAIDRTIDQIKISSATLAI